MHISLGPMVYLILSILCSTAIVLIFRMFSRYDIHNLPAITANYLVCVLCAWATLGSFPFNTNSIYEVWFPYALVLGGVLIGGFTLIAATVRTFSVTVGAVMQKMSLVITVVYTILAYGESVSVLKVTGILAACGAIVLINSPAKQKRSDVPSTDKPWYLFLIPIGAWVLNAVLEILLFRVERLTGENANLGFLATFFLTAGVLGTLLLLFNTFFNRFYRSSALRQKNAVRGRDILAGVILGVVNFGSLYFLLRVIGLGWEGSVVFPVNNVAIIALSAAFAVWFFRERLNSANWWGLALAVAAIGLIALTR